jgi:hypothetical protein
VGSDPPIGALEQNGAQRCLKLEVQAGDDRNDRHPHRGAGQPNFIKRLVGLRRAFRRRASCVGDGSARHAAADRQSETDRETLRWAFDRMRQELVDPKPGGFLILQQLVY